MSKKRRKEVVGTIKGIELVLRSADKNVEIPFRTGGHTTKKDRPRDKSYKRARWDD